MYYILYICIYIYILGWWIRSARMFQCDDHAAKPTNCCFHEKGTIRNGCHDEWSGETASKLLLSWEVDKPKAAPEDAGVTKRWGRLSARIDAMFQQHDTNSTNTWVIQQCKRTPKPFWGKPEFSPWIAWVFTGVQVQRSFKSLQTRRSFLSVTSSCKPAKCLSSRLDFGPF